MPADLPHLQPENDMDAETVSCCCTVPGSHHYHIQRDSHHPHEFDGPTTRNIMAGAVVIDRVLDRRHSCLLGELQGSAYKQEKGNSDALRWAQWRKLDAKVWREYTGEQTRWRR